VVDVDVLVVGTGVVDEVLVLVLVEVVDVGGRVVVVLVVLDVEDVLVDVDVLVEVEVLVLVLVVGVVVLLDVVAAPGDVRSSTQYQSNVEAWLNARAIPACVTCGNRRLALCTGEPCHQANAASALSNPQVMFSAQKVKETSHWLNRVGMLRPRESMWSAEA
jgi:hypothetical protein